MHCQTYCLKTHTHTPTSSIGLSKTGKSAKNSFKIEIKYKTWSNTAEQLTINCFSIFPKISFRQNCLEFMDITYHKFELCFICWKKGIQIIKLNNLLVFRLARYSSTYSNTTVFCWYQQIILVLLLCNTFVSSSVLYQPLSSCKLCKGLV